MTLAQFLEETGLALDDIYAGARSWSQLRAEADLPLRASGPNEEALRRACGRLLHVDDFTRIDTYRRLLLSETPPDPGAMSPRDRRLLRMLVATVAERRVGFIVDKLVGQQDIVIKALGKSLKKARGLAGATELGDQRVGLVLDAAALINEVLASPDGRQASLEAGGRVAKSADGGLS